MLLGLLVVVQAMVGVINVFLAIPVWVAALHLGIPAVLLALAIVGTFRLAAASALAVAAASPVAR